LLVGVIVKTKAIFAGRQGPPVLQPYYDLAKLLRKGAVYSRTTTVVFRAGPIVALAATLVAGLIAPLGRDPAPLAFWGDLVLFAYLLGLARFATVLAALDTGSSFEGMGASREAAFSTLAEPTLFLSLVVFALTARSASLSEISAAVTPGAWGAIGPSLMLVAFGLLVVTLAENSRIPVDDPATHLELTMIHEVMVLDHGGPDLAFILYGAAMKLMVVGSLLVLPFLPGDLGPLANAATFLAAMLGLAVVVGVIESVMARLRLVRVPLLLLGAFVVSALAVVMSIVARA
ncbi:NADH-quinone oxidoreductase subunit H, partial [bacterium]|nr:NADH-quinone oxidoreductase subunit H [bacterium]